MKRKTSLHPEIKILKARPIQDHSIPELEFIERLAQWLDSRFLIPGTNIRFGIDPMMSLFPIIGDLMTYVVSGMLIYAMYNKGASRKVVIKMILNSTLDAIIGAIPLVGTVFDIFYRANDRNVRLLKEHYFEDKHQGSGKGLLGAIALAALILVGAVFYGMYKLLEAIL
ncbi:MAG TPA: DUF4112 domain-containing protein [Chryseolinea sp.]|nr:DUF4112 domain-containing protein [Chryseolinea sp.]